jgi:hypothetical protein
MAGLEPDQHSKRDFLREPHRELHAEILDNLFRIARGMSRCLVQAR